MATISRLRQMRERAIAGTLFAETTLGRAVERLGFVQADPIRAPARAQDLILRQRVKAYRVGDLDSKYGALKLEEDYLYAYGFMPQATWRLLHPRMTSKLGATERRVLEIVTAHERLHPRELESYLGKRREVNAWGGYSKATTRVLERLHYRGLLRIAGREKGIRLYEPTAQRVEEVDPEERLRRLVLLIAGILSPLPETSLRAALLFLRYSAPNLEGRLAAVKKMLGTGELVGELLGDVRYVWPADFKARGGAEERVRFLAPFDPLVWDRRRFEQLWGWMYRFEAYTPPAKRVRGYYAMPMLWRDEIIGWVNITKQMDVEAGFVGKQPKEAAFRREFEAEVERFRYFLPGAAMN